MELYEKVMQVISYQYGYEVELNTYLDDIGDTLDKIEMVMALEEEFLIHIEDEYMETFTTVRDVCKHVEDLTRGDDYV